MTRKPITRRGAALQTHQHLTHSQRVIQGKGRPRTSWWTLYSREDFTAVARAEVQPEIKSYKTAEEP
jgi:hypothetical protein